MLRITNKNDFEIQKSENGYFVNLKTEDSFSEKKFILGEIENLIEFSACYRFNACWMIPLIGTKCSEIPCETQFILMRNSAGYTMIYALVDKYARSSIYSDDNKLCVLIETGDDQTKVNDGFVLYVINGDNPYDMVSKAAIDICDNLKTCGLRKDKKEPEFADMFGFCTYNSFYDNVTHEKIINAIDTFKRNGVNLGFLIVDVGWQNYDGNYTAGFGADLTKFPEGLANTIKISKDEYGLKKFMVWHTYNGYWSGLKPGAFNDYEIQLEPYYIPDRLKLMMEKIEEKDNTATAGMNFYATNLIHEKAGFITTDLFRFYFDFYSFLRKQGVDGSKLDAMSWIECFGQGKGGRVRMMQQLVSSLEAASLLNFNGEHINCSCCSNDFIYNALKSNVTRTSTDYFPDIPQSHGLHVLTNAHTSLWMGEFILPDWDMFQSGGVAGEFHAMSRAISGGPIYCADELCNQRFDIIRKLTTTDSKTGNCLYPAKITIDSMFVDPLINEKPVKVFNATDYAYLLGAFNCSYKSSHEVTVRGSGSPSDIYGIAGEKFYVYSVQDGGYGIFSREDIFDIILGEFMADIYVISEIKKICANIPCNYAVIGMTDKYNPPGFINRFDINDNVMNIDLYESGEFSLYIDKEPSFVSEDYTYDDKNLLKIVSKCDKIVIKI